MENKKYTILVVDDSKSSLLLLTKILASGGYHVLPASDAIMAFYNLEHHTVDLIVLDIQMPETDGFTLCGQIKEVEKWALIPVIFISSLTDVKDKLRAFQVGGADYVAKPFYPEEVIARVKNQLHIKMLELKLTDSNKNLEEKVKKRTQELQKTNNRLKRSLKEKEILIQEIHHRVKNNMAIISAFLNLQSQYILNDQDQQLFQESQDRIRTMSLVHEELYKSKDFTKIDLEEYVTNLVSNLCYSYAVAQTNVNMVVEISNISLNMDTTLPLGLILNELVTNSLKYAFKDKTKGTISIKAKKTGNKQYTMEVTDNGIGLPDNFDITKTPSLGLQIVNNLIHQLEGTLSWTNQKGTSYVITFAEIGL